MSINGSNNPFSCSPVVFSAGNSILSLGTITRVGNVFTFSVGFVWKINGVSYQNTVPIDLTINQASAGFFRIDNALLTTSNTIELQQGLPSNTVAIRPTYPETNILLTSWNISGTTIGDEESPISGTDVVKKTFSKVFEFNGTGANAIIPLNSHGYSEIRLINAGLTSVSGVNLSLMTGTNFELPYSGKPFFIWNKTGVDITLNNEDYANADYPLFLREGTNIILPNNHIVQFKWDAFGLYEIYKSFDPTKLDKVTTTGVERVYTINTDGTQGTKPLPAGGGKQIRCFYGSWNFTTINTWRSWGRNTSIMNVSDATGSLGTGATPSSFADFNFLTITNVTKLSKVSFSLRDPANIGFQAIEFYIKSFTLANNVARGSETNNQVLVQETYVLPSSGSNGFKDNFTIATHTLDNVTGIQIAFRQTTGTVSAIQGVQLILDFE